MGTLLIGPVVVFFGSPGWTRLVDLSSPPPYGLLAVVSYSEWASLGQVYCRVRLPYSLVEVRPSLLSRSVRVLPHVPDLCRVAVRPASTVVRGPVGVVQPGVSSILGFAICAYQAPLVSRFRSRRMV
ncbi:unnamed protein product [Dovyalis caffra]|uniref:Secreted protein n=1 Tax=Dovyalis caffra TaxID=77055 RepID=A0AAV1SMB5_9ROSI|nr:unnamed protein product [Dovyalis caffra]